MPERGGRGRRWIAGGLILTAALAAGAGAASGLSRVAPSAEDRVVARLEPLAGRHAHGGTTADLRADRRRAAACARRAYRRAHRARCPSSLGLRASAGARLLEGGGGGGEGAWSAPFTVASWPIDQVLLPTGKVLWMTRGDGTAEGGRAYVWDPQRRTTRSVPPPSVRYPDGVTRPANLFCSGHAQLADGRVLVAGGNLAYPDRSSDAPGSGFKGASWVFTFDPFTETWTREPDMRHGRWYPTVTTLPDGRALIVGGWDEGGDGVTNADIEVFTPGPRPGAGSLAVVARRATALYPRVLVVPEGSRAGAAAGSQVLFAGPSPADTAILSTAGWTWSGVPDLPTWRSWSSAVLLPGGVGGGRRVMVIGGYDARLEPSSQASTAVLDLDRVAAGWSPGPRLATGRSHLNAVLLPDGAVLAIGGGAGRGDYSGSLDSFYAGPVYAAERLDPGAAAWTSAGVQADERTYHSTAVLLPDGRVLSAGDDRPAHAAASARTAEIYAPPYRSTGAGPALTVAPEAVLYAVPFRVGTPDPGGIDRAVLVRPASVTHGNDMDQRVVPLGLTRQADGLTLTSPADASIAPPGYYMLFLIDAAGRPSSARFVRLDPRAPAPPPLPGRPGPAPSSPPEGVTPAGGPAPEPAPTAPVAAAGAPAAAPAPRAARRWALRGVRARLTGRRLRVVLAATAPAGRVMRVTLATPRVRGQRSVRSVRARFGGAGTQRMAFGMRAPARWRTLSLPVAVRVSRRGRTEVARGRVLVRRSPPRHSVSVRLR